MKNILITGSNGQLGSELREESIGIEKKLFFTDYQDLDITNHDNVRQFLLQNKIDIVINCAAYTAVDLAEKEVDKAIQINHKAVENFAILCEEFKIRLIHISTDYVFDGKNYKPYKENDETNPQNIYGITKRKGEEAIRKRQDLNAIIIRTSWVYSSYGQNFVKTMLKLSRSKSELNVIDDQIGSPTYAKDLALFILKLIKDFDLIQGVEIIHYSNEGICSWFDFAKAIFEILKKNIQINPIPGTEYLTPATRPHYSVMSKEKARNIIGEAIPYWKDALQNCINKIENNGL